MPEASEAPQSLEEAIALREAQGEAFFDAPAEAPAEAAPQTLPEAGTPVPAPAAVPAAPSAAPVEPVTPAASYVDANGTAVERAEIEAALTVARGLRTESGVRLMIARGLEKLGKSPEAIQAFMTGQITAEQAQATPSAPPDPLAEYGLADDDVIDGETLRRVIAQVQQSATEAATAAATQQVQPVQDAWAAQQAQQTEQVVDSTLIQLLGTNGDPTTVDPDTAALVMERAKQFYDPNQWSPAHVRDAVLRGHADLVAQLDRVQQARVARLAEVANTVPTTIGGGTTAGAEEPPPIESFEDSMAAARAMGFFDL